MYNRALWRVGLYRFNKRIKRKQFKRIELAKAMSHHELDINLVKDPIIYLADGNYRKRVFDATKGKFVSGEHIVQGVIDNVKGSRNLLCIDVDYSYFSESLGLKKRLEDGAQYWIPFEILITDDIRRECKSGIESVTNSVGQLFRKKEFQKILTYEGIRLWSTLEVVFRTLVSDIYLPTYILSIESAKRLLLKIRPSTIFLPYETGIYAMAFIVAAEGLKIRTIGMQHGIIHKGHLDYSINNLKTSSSMGCPIPSLLLLFGEFYRKLLVETFSYPSNRVKVVGNPAYENVQDMACGVNKGEVLKFLGFDSSRRTVLVATSMHQAKYGREEYDVLIVESLVQSFAGMEDIQVVVKAHPAEDPSVYSNLVTSKGANNFRIIRDYPIQPLISICDVFVSVLSTTILEAMAMKKPVVIAQGSETIHRDLMSIGGSGAAVRASIKDISRIIIQILNNADFKNELIDRSSEIIKSHFNVPARGISMRIADIIIHNSDDENSRYYNSQFRF